MLSYEEQIHNLGMNHVLRMLEDMIVNNTTNQQKVFGEDEIKLINDTLSVVYFFVKERLYYKEEDTQEVEKLN